MDESKTHLDWSATSYTSDRKPSQKGSNSGLPEFFDRKSFRLKIKNDVYFSLSEVLSPTVGTHFSSKSVLFGDLLNKLPPSQWLILAKSTKFRHAIFTSETENVTRAKAPR